MFLWAKNQTHQRAHDHRSFDIVDTQGNKYYPVALDPRVNPYAWTSQTLAPLADRARRRTRRRASGPRRAGCCCSSSTTRSTPTGR